MPVLRQESTSDAPPWKHRDWRMRIGGTWQSADASREVIDPGTGTVIATVPEAGITHVDASVAAARSAFDSGVWHVMPADDRARILWRIADLIDERADDIAVVEAVNQGSPLQDVRAGLIPEAARVFRYYAGWVDKVAGRAARLRVDVSEFLTYTLRSPVGVAALITPWNSPLLMAAWKAAPALAAGCSCVVKPAELTPLTTLMLAEIAQEAGLPEGVLNVVTGDGVTVGGRLAAHPDVDKVAFTGSTSVGRDVVRAATGNLKKVSLELGGKSPVVVFADADVDAAIDGAARAIFSNAGQVCTAGSRLIVAEEIYQEVVDGVARVARTLNVGHSLDPRSEMGPVISAEQRRTVMGYIESGIRDGATLVAGGQEAGPGFFIEPTVLGDTRPEMRAVTEEIFGPVVTAMTFGSPDEAVALANSSRYGLAASVWTRDVGAAHRVASRLRVGRVGINVHGLADVTMPTGGFKESGWGRELGPEGLDLFLETTSVFNRLDAR
ncbi:aldehyde dehydrogenase family protein [Mycolicibacterium sp. BiH015]|uniref:aldehyde dehydrogenase family protein n=1 Tax=Mycolicibacterium sp. BiH015 TaxID=3018808 RepID=UPI0022DFA8CD|nr:aldehyde dehydrogenase family protein [Mycolicibacterium sp. BiH015]MDA2893328.1 aldehyde dehydrogenase family protein [Mycolicibacterium sp. BiH015]